MRTVQLSSGLAVWIKGFALLNLAVLAGLVLYASLAGEAILSGVLLLAALLLGASIRGRLLGIVEAWATEDGIRIARGREIRVIPYSRVLAVSYTAWSPLPFLTDRVDLVVEDTGHTVETVSFMPLWTLEKRSGKPSVVADLDARVTEARLRAIDRTLGAQGASPRTEAGDYRETPPPLGQA